MRTLSGGRPLPPNTRERLEAAFDLPLEHVRLHTDAEGTELAEEHGAEALTIGRHIAFGPGRFRPESEEGTRLLAHELAHVVRQDGGEEEPALVHGPASESAEPVEREADGAAERIVRGEPARVSRRGAAWTMRARIMRRARAGAASPAPEAVAPAPAAPDAVEPMTAPAAPEVQEAAPPPAAVTAPGSSPAVPPPPNELELELESEETEAFAVDLDAAKQQVAARATIAPRPSDPRAEPTGPVPTPDTSTPLVLQVAATENATETDAPTRTVEAVARAPPTPGTRAFGHAAVALSPAPIVQTKLAVSSPGDALEREADAVVARVLRAGVPSPPSSGGVSAGGVQCMLPPTRGPPIAAASRALARTVASAVASPGGGRPLDTALRARIEPHVGLDLGHVRVRRGPDAAAAARDLHARAFTSGSTIFLAGESSPNDVALMAHEATHVAQQQTVAAARTTLMRDVLDELPAVSVNDLIPDWILDGVRTTVRAIPGYILLTYLAGRDPLSDEPAPASPQEVLEALLTRGPFGAAVGTVLQAIDVLGEVFTFVMESLAAHDLTLARLQRDIDSAWEEFSIANGIAGNVAIVDRYVSALLRDVDSFVESIVDRVLELVRSVVPEVVEPLLATPAIEPVWNLAKKVMHYDPLRGVAVEAPTVEIIADFLRLVGEEQRLAQMQERGTLQETADWLDTQLATFAGLITELGTLFGDALEAIQPQNLPDLLTNLAALAQRAFGFVLRVAEFELTLYLKILELIKDALLGWLSENAHSIPGFHLLTVILGQNPFTGEQVPRTAENLIKGFITLLPGGEATYDELAESGVIGSAAERIEGEISRLGISLELVTGIFLGIWDTLTLDDLLDPLGAFGRILALFGEPLARLIEFVGVVIEVVVTLVLRLMNFPSELLASVINNTLSAIRDIRNDPVGFLLNMMEALKAGFTAFFGNIGKYLLDGLLAWLFRGLGKLGIRLPTDLSLASILDLIFQVLGLTAEHLWEKLAEHIGPEKVQMIRDAINRLAGAWTFIQDVEREGLPAIWRYIKDQLSSLWQTVLETAMEWVMTQIITSGTMKLLSFLDPTFIMSVINGCIALFNAVQAAIEYLRDMLEILNLYVGTLAQVAAGNIAPGAEKIEAGLAAVVPMAIGFLAYLLGIDDVPKRIADIVLGVREVIDRAIDWLIEQALRLGSAVLAALGADRGAVADATAGPASQQAETGFSMAGQPHTLTATFEGERVSVVIASRSPQDLLEAARDVYSQALVYNEDELADALEGFFTKWEPALAKLAEIEKGDRKPETKEAERVETLRTMAVDLVAIGARFNLRDLSYRELGLVEIEVNRLVYGALIEARNRILAGRAKLAGGEETSKIEDQGKLFEQTADVSKSFDILMHRTVGAYEAACTARVGAAENVKDFRRNVFTFAGYVYFVDHQANYIVPDYFVGQNRAALQGKVYLTTVDPLLAETDLDADEARGAIMSDYAYTGWRTTIDAFKEDALNVAVGTPIGRDRGAMFLAAMIAEARRNPNAHVTNLLLMAEGGKGPFFGAAPMTAGGTSATEKPRDPTLATLPGSQPGQPPVKVTDAEIAMVRRSFEEAYGVDLATMVAAGPENDPVLKEQITTFLVEQARPF